MVLAALLRYNRQLAWPPLVSIPKIDNSRSNAFGIVTTSVLRDPGFKVFVSVGLGYLFKYSAHFAHFIDFKEVNGRICLPVENTHER